MFQQHKKYYHEIADPTLIFKEKHTEFLIWKHVTVADGSLMWSNTYF